MKKRPLLLIGAFVLCFALIGMADSGVQRKTQFTFNGLSGLEKAPLSSQAMKLLRQNGFVVIRGGEDEMYDVYAECKKRHQPIFVTTDAVLHTCHIFFDYVLRILEIERLYGFATELTERMIDLSRAQYEEAEDDVVKEAARLNIGFFMVAKKIFHPDVQPGYGLEDLIKKELNNMEAHERVEFRELLTYVSNPSLFETPYAYEDYSQYIPRGHYTRNKTFKKYFKAMMWYGRIDFKLRPKKSKTGLEHGRKMTLQAILMTDALMKDEKAYQLWKKIYEPTVYFVGKTDDMFVDDYKKLIKELFLSEGSVDKYNEQDKLVLFIEKAMKLRPPKVLSGAAFIEDGSFDETTKAFRFMGQRFIPDSYMFQELVFRIKDGKILLKYNGSGKPFTMENVPAVGPARAFPRGLDVLAVLGSKRALDILEKEGDTAYDFYDDQLLKLKKEFAALSTEEWTQNLYWRWLHCLLPLIVENEDQRIPAFMQNTAWTDKEIQAVLGSWTELRHDTILYAKQSYPIVATAMPYKEPELTFGYVEPYPEVYKRIKDMMADLRNNLARLGINIEGIPERISRFEEMLASLATISEKELDGLELTKDEYDLIWNIGRNLGMLKAFPRQIMKKITSGTDDKIDLVADVHTDLNTKQVLEEGVGAPFDIFVIVKDMKDYRLCRGAVFSYYEFKHPMADRLTDEKWQEMRDRRPPQPEWTKSFISW